MELCNNPRVGGLDHASNFSIIVPTLCIKVGSLRDHAPAVRVDGRHRVGPENLDGSSCWHCMPHSEVNSHSVLDSVQVIWLQERVCQLMCCSDSPEILDGSPEIEIANTVHGDFIDTFVPPILPDNGFEIVIELTNCIWVVHLDSNILCSYS